MNNLLQSVAAGSGSRRKLLVSQFSWDAKLFNLPRMDEGEQEKGNGSPPDCTRQ